MYITRDRFDDMQLRLAAGEELTLDEQRLLHKQQVYEKNSFGFFNVYLTKKQCEIIEFAKAPKYKETIVRGGVRSGKTVADVVAVCNRVGGYYPAGYEEYETIYGDKIYKPLFVKMDMPNTRKKCRVWISCLDRPMQIAAGGMQETLMDLLPKSWIADVHTLCGKYIIKVILKNGSIIEFKSAAVGRRGYQSATIDMLVADEGHPQPVIEEGLARSGTHPVKFIYSYYPEPEPDTAWAHDYYIVPELDGRSPEYRKVTAISYLDNVMIPKPQRDDQIQRWKDADIYEQRVNGNFADVGGRVYRTFQRGRHVMNAMDIPAFRANGGDPPPEWPKFMGVDTHNSKKGCSAIMCALDPKTGRRYYFNEYQDPNDPYSWIEYFNKVQAQYEFVTAFIDPSAYATDANGFCIGEKLEEMTTIPFEKATRSHAQGRYAVLMGLAVLKYPDGAVVDGLPGIIVCDHCHMTIRQMETYSFKGDTTEVIKANDEFCDCMRYVEVTTPQNWYGPGSTVHTSSDYGNPNLNVI